MPCGINCPESPSSSGWNTFFFIVNPHHKQYVIAVVIFLFFISLAVSVCTKENWPRWTWDLFLT